MAKRKLNKRQEWRVQRIQEERVRRAERKATRLSSDAAAGPEQEGLIIANYGAAIEVEDAAGTVRRCALRQNLDRPVVGDRVVWQPVGAEGVVTAILPRKSLLARPDMRGEMRPLAANVDCIMVVSAPLPIYETYLIDQYLAAAEATGIEPVLVLNKTDLLEQTDAGGAEATFERYAALGYSVLHSSTVRHHGLDELRQSLKDRTAVFAGQSGVGKSSLIRTLVPEQQIEVREISEQSGLGRHTTSTSRLYHLPDGGAVIDSPGVRDFRLWDMSRQELAHGFVEFRPFLGQCRFRNCRHEGEPGCALAEAKDSGAIAPERLDNFRRIAAAAEAHQANY